MEGPGNKTKAYFKKLDITEWSLFNQREET